MHLDRYDLAILDALQDDGGLSNLELAERIGLSASPCSRRVKRLEEEGLIRRRVTLLDQARLDLKLTAFIQISMDRHTPERFAHFEAQVRSYPEVLECYLITGQTADYILKVVVPDMDAYRVFLLERITRIEGVTGVHSSFVLTRVAERTALPLGHLRR
jgi:Lrp/AsnC family transcriptional regulator, leucine-responsive regulatory protein